MSIASVTVTINGASHALTYNQSTGKWEGEITAPSVTSWGQTDHKYGVVITATNGAGTSATADRTHATFGSVLALRVLEQAAPEVTISNPGNGAHLITNTPTFSITLSDGATGSGIDLSTLTMTLDSSALDSTNATITPTATSDGYTLSVTPLAALNEGAHTLTCSVYDNDGNVSQTATSAFTVDTVAPTLNITTPSNGFTVGSASLVIAGTTNDQTSSPVSVAISVNGSTISPPTVGSDGSFSATVTLTAGQNTIVVTATDSSGKESTVTLTGTYDASVPVFDNITLLPNPANTGATLIITATISEA